MKYSHKNVIIDPNDRRIKLGERYWSSDTIKGCVDKANNGEVSVKLVAIEIDSSYPFVVRDHNEDEFNCCAILPCPKKRKVSTEEYSYEDVIFYPEDERLRVGEKYWFGDSPKGAIDHANGNGTICRLVGIDLKINYPFKMRYYGKLTRTCYLIKPREKES